MTDKTCWTGTACSARCFWAASPQRGSWRQPAQGKYSFPCDDWNRLKICGNHLLPARGFRQDATHHFPKWCIVAPSFRGESPGLPLWKQSPPFPAFCLYSFSGFSASTCSMIFRFSLRWNSSFKIMLTCSFVTSSGWGR